MMPNLFIRNYLFQITDQSSDVDGHVPILRIFSDLETIRFN